MTKNQIAERIDPKYPFVYAPTTGATKLIFKDGKYKVGYFEFTKHSDKLELENKYTFIEFGENAQNYRTTRNDKYVTVVNGDDLIDVEYPAHFNNVETLDNIDEIDEIEVEKNGPTSKTDGKTI